MSQLHEMEYNIPEVGLVPQAQTMRAFQSEKHHLSNEWLKANTAITLVFSRIPLAV